MTYLVSGAAGFIGFHVCKYLLDNGETVIGFDSINDYYDPSLKFDRLKELGIGDEAVLFGIEARSALYGRFSFTRLFLEDSDGLNRLFDQNRYDFVIHLAAQAGVRHSIDNPSAYLDSNMHGFLNILEACRRVRIPHLVYASSSSVYGLNAKRPYSVQDNTDHPVSLYGATKKANELMAHSYSHLYGIPTTGLRFFTVYGPWGRPDMAYYKFANAMMKGEPIDVYNGGDMYRDFTYIDDIVRGIVAVSGRHSGFLSKDGATPYRIYNIGNSKSERLSSFIEVLEISLGKKAVLRNLPMQMGDVYATEADVSDMARDFGWTPSMTVREGLSRFARWYLEYQKRMVSV